MYTHTHLHVHVHANSLESAKGVCVAMLCGHMDAGLTLVVTDAGHLNHFLYGHSSQDLIQTLGGAEAAGNVQSRVAFVVCELQGGSSRQQPVDHVHLLCVDREMQCRLQRGEGGERGEERGEEGKKKRKRKERETERKGEREKPERERKRERKSLVNTN